MKLLGCLACCVSAALVISLLCVPIRAWPDPAPFEAYLRPVAAWGVCLVLVVAAGCVLAQPRVLVGAAGRGLAVLGLAVALLWPAYALAQAAADTTVDLGGIVSDVRSTAEALIGIAVAAVLGWLAYLAKKNLGLSIDQKMRESLHSALMSGVNLGLDRIQEASDDVKLDVKSTVVANSVSYARVAVPKAVKHFKLDEGRLADMARAKLAERLPTEAKVAPAAPDA